MLYLNYLFSKYSLIVKCFGSLRERCYISVYYIIIIIIIIIVIIIINSASGQHQRHSHKEPISVENLPNLLLTKGRVEIEKSLEM